jgi:hypothetical protein
VLRAEERVGLAGRAGRGSVRDVLGDVLSDVADDVEVGLCNEYIRNLSLVSKKKKKTKKEGQARHRK